MNRSRLLAVSLLCLLLGVMISAKPKEALDSDTVDKGDHDNGIQSILAIEAGNGTITPEQCYQCSSPCSRYQCCVGNHPQCCTDGVNCYCCG